METAAASKLLPFCGHAVGTVYGEKGYAYIKNNAAAFRWLATNNSGVLVLTDLRDAGSECLHMALQKYVYDKLPNPPENYIFHFSVNELESWLLADREGIAQYLEIDISRIPVLPDHETNPKECLINLARRSKRKFIREGIAPPAKHRSLAGPEYVPLMRQYIYNYWDIKNAVINSPDLRRCVNRLNKIT